MFIHFRTFPIHCFTVSRDRRCVAPLGRIQLRFAWPSLRHELQRWTSRSGVLCRAMGDAAPLGRFDVAVLQHVLCSAAQPRELLREVRKVLKPGRAEAKGRDLACANEGWWVLQGFQVF